jgi:hypothetical protein
MGLALAVILGLVALSMSSTALSSSSSLTARERVLWLERLYFLKMNTDRDLRVAVERYKADYKTSWARLAPYVAGLLVGALTLNPKSAMAAAKAATAIANAIEAAPDKLRPAIRAYEMGLRAIAEAEQRLGVEPGITYTDIAALLVAAKKAV